MLIERDGYFYVPIKTFARLAGVSSSRVVDNIKCGVIHYSYFIRLDSHDDVKPQIFLRHDKAKAFRAFIDTHVSRTEFAKMVEQKYNVKITEQDVISMVALGYVPVVFFKRLYNESPCLDRCIRTFWNIGKIPEFYSFYVEYIEDRNSRKKENYFLLESDEVPKNVEVYRPNENAIGFILTDEQIEKLKVFRACRENKEPLF